MEEQRYEHIYNYLSTLCHVTERQETALTCIALSKQQQVVFSDMLQSVQGQSVWVDSDPIWGCGLSKRLMNTTEPELYPGSNMWGELLKLFCVISAGNMIRLKSEMLILK